MAASIPYRRLPGRKRGLLHGASLWLGDDHLLAVNNWRFTETYKRYYYRDIQAITVTKKPRFVLPVYWVVVLCAAPVAAMILQAAGLQIAFQVTLYALVLAALWLIVTSLATSCVCRIRTAVSCDELPSLYRLRTARKALDVLEPAVAAAQGPLPGKWTELLEGVPEAGPPLALPAPPAVAPPSKGWGFLEAALYLSLLLSAMLIWLAGSPGIDAMRLVLTAAQLAAGLAVLIGARRSGRSPWPALCALLLVGGMTYLDAALAAFEDARARKTPVTINRVTGFRDFPVVRGIYSAGCLALGAAGLLAAARRAGRKE